MTATMVVQASGVKAVDDQSNDVPAQLMDIPGTESEFPVRQVEKLPMQPDGIVRLSRVEVYPEHLEEYLKMAAEVWQTSLLTEPGVLTMYALSEKENPNVITILETYASREAYKSHIASAHSQKYKQGTLHMVKDLKLLDQTEVNPANHIINFIR